MDANKDPQQQDIAQESTTSAHVPAAPPQKKISIIVPAIALCMLAIIALGFIFRDTITTQRKINPIKQDLATKVSPYQTLEITNTSLNDAATSLYFSDGMKIFKQSLDGTKAVLISTLPYYIEQIAVLSDESLLLKVDNSTYTKKNEPSSPPYVMTKGASKYFIVQPNSSQPREINSEDRSYGHAISTVLSPNKYYVVEKPSGQADIFTSHYDNTNPTKIGVLTNKYVKYGCMMGQGCPENIHPVSFFPSFDESYLLTGSPGGGGYGYSAVAVSRDGKRVYDFKFHWFASSAVWTGTNTLLTKDNNIQKFVTLNEDGSFSETPIIHTIEDSLYQKNLSPSGRNLVVVDQANRRIYLYDIDQLKLDAGSFAMEKARKRIPFENPKRGDIEYDVIGWNKNSDKILLSIAISMPGEDSNTKMQTREVWLYDTNTEKITLVATLNPDKKELGEKPPKASFQHFAIR